MIFFHFPQEFSSFLLVHAVSEMELLSSNFSISSTLKNFPAAYSKNPLHTKPVGFTFQYFPRIIRSKKSSYQDYQEYAKPSRLLPATEVTDASSLKNVFTSFSSERTNSLFKIELQTSKLYGSDLTDVNSGILLCLIDENGSSVLQRLPATSVPTDTWSEDKVKNETLHFQRGSVDEFTFEGPNLGRIIAVWIGLESGQWRISGIKLTVVCPGESSSAENNQENKQVTGLQYTFQFDDILLGENREESMMEFRPQSVTAFSKDESNFLYEKSLNLPSLITSNEESMKEYTDLKFSLLFYDAVLILTGSAIASISTGENAAYAFLTGGLCGFLYLLLLQRSVDELGAPELVSSEKEGSFGRIFGRLKGSVSSLVLAFAFGIIVVKYASGEDAVKLTSKELLFGMMGFVMCKVSALLAAFKPMPLGFRENKQSS